MQVDLPTSTTANCSGVAKKGLTDAARDEERGRSGRLKRPLSILHRKICGRQMPTT